MFSRKPGNPGFVSTMFPRHHLLMVIRHVAATHRVNQTVYVAAVYGQNVVLKSIIALVLILQVS